MRDPDEHTSRPAETLQVGSSRTPRFPRVPARWRQPATALSTLLLGMVAGAAAMSWWQEDSAPPSAPPQRFDEHAVELVLFEAARLRTPSSGPGPGSSSLHVDSAFLLSGAITSTVLTIDNADGGLDVRSPALPLTISSTDRFRPVELEIVVRSCEVATQWTPTDRPFIITWRDESGKEHLDSAGDFDPAMARVLTRYIETVCGGAPSR